MPKNRSVFRWGTTHSIQTYSRGRIHHYNFPDKFCPREVRECAKKGGRRLQGEILPRGIVVVNSASGLSFSLSAQIDCTVLGVSPYESNLVQSVSKPFTYALVHEEIGADELHSYVGQEPSGRLFNDICLDHASQLLSLSLSLSLSISLSLSLSLSLSSRGFFQRSRTIR